MDDIDVRDTTAEPESYLTPIRRNPGESITMSFPDAMAQIIAGKKVRRLDWTNDTDHGLLKDGWLKVYTTKEGDSKQDYHSWLVSDGDMEAADWIVMKEGN